MPYVGHTNCSTGPDAGSACFGAGLMRTVLPDGVTLWGKTGHDMGYASGVFATRDLSRVGAYSVAARTLSNDAPAAAARLAAAAFAQPPDEPRQLATALTSRSAATPPRSDSMSSSDLPAVLGIQKNPTAPLIARNTVSSPATGRMPAEANVGTK